MGTTPEKRRNLSFLQTETGNSVLPSLRYCQSSEALWAIVQNAQLMSPCNSNAPEPNFTKSGCEGSLDVVGLDIPVVLVFSAEFLLVSSQRPSEDGGV